MKPFSRDYSTTSIQSSSSGKRYNNSHISQISNKVSTHTNTIISQYNKPDPNIGINMRLLNLNKPFESLRVNRLRNITQIKFPKIANCFTKSFSSSNILKYNNNNFNNSNFNINNSSVSTYLTNFSKEEKSRNNSIINSYTSSKNQGFINLNQSLIKLRNKNKSLSESRSSIFLNQSQIFSQNQSQITNNLNQSQFSSSLNNQSQITNDQNDNITNVDNQVLFKLKGKLKQKKNNSQKFGSLLMFDSILNVFNESQVAKKYGEKFMEERERRKNELFYDYDKDNKNQRQSSFSGNNPGLLKKKVLFVKNVFDYIYPRIVVNRMRFLEKQKEMELMYLMKRMEEGYGNPNSKIYKIKYKWVQENIRMLEKQLLRGGSKSERDIFNEKLKNKRGFIKLKKIFVNGHQVTRLARVADYKQ